MRKSDLCTIISILVVVVMMLVANCSAGDISLLGAGS
ncbi:hypothetical protein JOE25_000641 [Serratia sp. PL17]|nr:hypothetical protein [Serratia sp. PL17]